MISTNFIKGFNFSNFVVAEKNSLVKWWFFYDGSRCGNCKEHKWPFAAKSSHSRETMLGYCTVFEYIMPGSSK